MNTISNTKEKLMTMFREYWNDYLTVDAYAQAYGTTRENMYRIITLGRTLHNANAEKLKGKLS